MKKPVVLIALFALSCSPPVLTSCTAPSARTVRTVQQTLKAVGETAEAALALSAQLYRDGKINAAQARHVMDFFDTRWQPVFRLAVAAARTDISTVPASTDLIALAAELANLVASFSKP